MRLITLRLFAILLLTGCSVPEETDIVERELNDDPALSLVLKSMEAHGGKEAWYQNGILQFRWRYLMTDRGPDAIIDTIQTVDPQSLAVVHSFPNSAGKFGLNTGKTWTLPKDLKFSPPPKFWALTPLYFLGIPFVFDDPNAYFELLPEVIAFEGNYYAQVKVTYNQHAGDTPDDYYILLIDSVSKITRGAIYIVTSPLVYPDAPAAPKLITLDNLKNFDGVLLPTSHRTFSIDAEGVIGEQIRTTEVSQIKWLDRKAVDLSIPAGAQIIE